MHCSRSMLRFVFLCVLCMHVHRVMWKCVCTCVHMYIDSRGQACMLFCTCQIPFSEPRSLTDLKNILYVHLSTEIFSPFFKIPLSFLVLLEYWLLFTFSAFESFIIHSNTDKAQAPGEYILQSAAYYFILHSVSLEDRKF